MTRTIEERLAEAAREGSPRERRSTERLKEDEVIPYLVKEVLRP